MEQGLISIKQTSDGSHTLYHNALGEHYHSTYGAMAESRYVYIQEGLMQLIAAGYKEISLLEVGFGTGLNAMLSLEVANKEAVHLTYYALEPYPLPAEVLSGLNYPTYFPEDLASLFNTLHRAPHNETVDVSPYFRFCLQPVSLEEASLPTEAFDLVYFDAFAPDKHPEVWQVSNLAKVAAACRKDGILVSYCAKGQFKRNLRSSGFSVERVPGPPGKWHMIRARQQ